MELVNEFRVAVPLERAWDVLTDVECIVPCMPGAELHEIDGDEFRGAVKVKVGPITAQYRGRAVFQEKNETTHRAVIKAEGRETRGQGNANALITAVLTPDGDSTVVIVRIDLTISGKAAQFGRGVLADVSSRLVAQFVQRLEADVLAGNGVVAAADELVPPATGQGAAGGESSDTGNSAPADRTRGLSTVPAAPAANGLASAGAGPGVATPVNLLGVVAGPLLRRTMPVAALLVLICWLLHWGARTRSSRGVSR